MTLDPINIGIKNAVITRITTELKTDSKGEPSVEITLQGEYRTSFGLKIAEFMFWNGSWATQEHKIDIPQDILDQLHTVFKDLTPLLYDKVNHMFKELPAVSQEAETVQEKKEERVEDDEIPF